MDRHRHGGEEDGEQHRKLAAVTDVLLLGADLKSFGVDVQPVLHAGHDAQAEDKVDGCERDAAHAHICDSVSCNTVSGIVQTRLG